MDAVRVDAAFFAGLARGGPARFVAGPAFCVFVFVSGRAPRVRRSAGVDFDGVRRRVRVPGRLAGCFFVIMRSLVSPFAGDWPPVN